MVSAEAATIIDEWASVKPEPAPELKPVTVDPKTTALLVMDLVKGSCNAQRRPRCVASIPVIAKLMDEARANGVMLVNTSRVREVWPMYFPRSLPSRANPC